MGRFIRAAAVADIPVGEGRVAEVDGRQVALFSVDGKICAIDNVCAHRGGPLGEGMVAGTVVTCPWHGWQFDVTTGVSPAGGGAVSVKKFNCKVEGSDVLVEVD